MIAKTAILSYIYLYTHITNIHIVKNNTVSKTDTAHQKAHISYTFLSGQSKNRKQIHKIVLTIRTARSAQHFDRYRTAAAGAHMIPDIYRIPYRTERLQCTQSAGQPQRIPDTMNAADSAQSAAQSAQQTAKAKR